MRPRLIVSAALRTQDEFRALAEDAVRLNDAFDVRIVVSHLAHKNYAALRWPDDPYIQYSYNLTGMFDLYVPEEMRGLFDQTFVDENRALMRDKLDILTGLGLKGAAYVREPAYMPAEVYDRYPDWRGPRIDQPRRSTHPLFALCFHQPEVQALYRRVVRALTADFPGLDTWVAHTNDAGAGFCWSANLYNSPNGPAACKAAGPAPAVAAYHRAVIDGAADAGVEAVSLNAGGFIPPDNLRALPLLPKGAYIPTDGALTWMGLAAPIAMTAPIRCLANPLAALFTAAPLAKQNAPDLVFYRLDHAYMSDSLDVDSSRLELTMLKEGQRVGAVSYRRALDLLEGVLAEEYGREAAPQLTEGYRVLYETFRIERMSGMMRSLTGPLYAGVSTRWLTRPLVAFQEALMDEETAYYMPHIFNSRGEEGKRELLDVHGLLFEGQIDRGCEYALREGWYAELAAGLERAAAAFESAGVARGQTLGKACRLLACIWRTSRNTIEFALLRKRASDCGFVPAVEYKTYPDPDRERLYEVLRNEIDNTRRFLAIWGTEDPERVVSLARTPRDEDTLDLGPDLRQQMEAKIRLMLEHWEDVERLYKTPHF